MSVHSTCVHLEWKQPPSSLNLNSGSTHTSQTCSHAHSSLQGWQLDPHIPCVEDLAAPLCCYCEAMELQGIEAWREDIGACL